MATLADLPTRRRCFTREEEEAGPGGVGRHERHAGARAHPLRTRRQRTSHPARTREVARTREPEREAAHQTLQIERRPRHPKRMSPETRSAETVKKIRIGMGRKNQGIKRRENTANTCDSISRPLYPQQRKEKMLSEDRDFTPYLPLSVRVAEASARVLTVVEERGTPEQVERIRRPPARWRGRSPRSLRRRTPPTGLPGRLHPRRGTPRKRRTARPRSSPTPPCRAPRAASRRPGRPPPSSRSRRPKRGWVPPWGLRRRLRSPPGTTGLSGCLFRLPGTGCSPPSKRAFRRGSSPFRSKTP